jgi:hypothetical protein
MAVNPWWLATIVVGVAIWATLIVLILVVTS